MCCKRANSWMRSSLPFFDINQYSVSSDQLDEHRFAKCRRKIKLAAGSWCGDNFARLMAQNHITISYMARAFISALLLSYALLEAITSLTLLAALLHHFYRGLARFWGLIQDWRLARRQGWRRFNAD